MRLGSVCETPKVLVNKLTRKCIELRIKRKKALGHRHIMYEKVTQAAEIKFSNDVLK